MESLKSKAIIVQLKTSHWTAKKYDPSVTKEVDENHKAFNSGRFSKTLLISTLLDDINTCVGKARTYHYKFTLPWDDAGQRILPVAEYLNYVAKMDEIQVEHKQLVDIFIDAYPDLRENAKNRLNTLFSEDDYPSERELIKKFHISYGFTPISDSSDLRIDISKGEVNEIKRNIEEGLNEKINTAKASIVSNSLKVVEAMYEKLSEKKATFRDSLVTNIQDLIGTIPLLNFDEDVRLIDLRKKLKKLNVQPALLRKDTDARKETAKKAKKVIKYIKKIEFPNIVKETETPVKTTKAKRIKK